MKNILNLIFCILTLAAVTGCQKEQEPVFEVVGETEFPDVPKEGGYLTVIMRTTQAYIATPDADWCHVVYKQPIGFKIQVDENDVLQSRECAVVVETTDFEPIVIKVSQEKGELYFRMDDEEKTKSFPAEGGSQVVSLQTNMAAYTVRSDADDWVKISNRTKEGFEITCDPREDYQLRTAKVKILVEDMEQAVVEVSQKGLNAVKNNCFTADFENWSQDAEVKFTLDSWKPSYITGKTVRINEALFTAEPFSPVQAYLLQEITGITDGKYTFSCVGKVGGTNGKVYMVFRNSDGTEEKMEVENMEGNPWGLRTMEVEVTGGECSIGLLADVTSKSSQRWINITDFRLE